MSDISLQTSSSASVDNRGDFVVNSEAMAPSAHSEDGNIVLRIPSALEELNDRAGATLMRVIGSMVRGVIGSSPSTQDLADFTKTMQSARLAARDIMAQSKI